MTNNAQMERRSFLKALSAGMGAAAAATMMPSLAWGMNNGRPQRFVVYFVPHGWPIEQVDKFGTGSNWLMGNQILGSLAPWQDKVSLLRGISQTNNGGHGGVHHVLTDGGYGKDSVDTSIARALGERPWVQSVASPGSSYFCRINMENNAHTQDSAQPLDFYEQTLGKAENQQATSQNARYRSQLLAMSERQLEQLSARVNGISREENRLAGHIDALREIKARSDKGLSFAAGADLSSLKQRLESTRHLDGNNMVNTTAILDGHIDALSAALISGAVKVSTIRSHSTGGQPIANFPGGPGVPGNPHMSSHNGNREHRIAHYGKNLRWYIDRLATLVEKLDVPDPLDPAHTVLENTTILYTSEFADGSHCTVAKEISVAGGKHFTYFPMILIGGGAGQLKTGGVIQTPNSHHDVMKTLAYMHGGERNNGKIITDIFA